MSNFESYAEKASTLAAETFGEYFAAEEALAAAESKRKLTPVLYNVPVDAEYIAKSHEAEAAYQRANANLQEVRKGFEQKRREFEKIRADFAEAAEKEFAADPAKIDHDVLTLVNSGILSPREFEKLAADAASRGNHTMVRIIAQKAIDTAEKTENPDEARKYRLVGVAARETASDVSDFAGWFEILEVTFNKCLMNPAMYRMWDDLTKNAREALRG